jgi:plasmid stability protein
MTNLTISLDEDIIREARVRAIREGTSLSAKVREFLAQYAQEQPSHLAGQGFLNLARQSQANSQGTRWSREDAYDRVYPGSAKSKVS